MDNMDDTKVLATKGHASMVLYECLCMVLATKDPNTGPRMDPRTDPTIYNCMNTTKDCN